MTPFRWRTLLEQKAVAKGIGLAAAALLRAWFSTLDCKVAYHNPAVDPAYPFDHQRRIFLFWHEHLLLPLSLWGGCNITMLLSQHADASLVAHLAAQFGYDCVRGSSGRGSIRALREMLHAGQGRHLTITPDGPRGPRRKMASGAVFLASKLQLPVVLLGVGFERPYRFERSWDNFAIPRLGSRVRIILSDEYHIPAVLGKERLDAWCRLLEDDLTALTDEATQWADSRTKLVGECRKLPGPKTSIFYDAAPP